MAVENLLYRYDKSKIKVTSGDLTEGYWTLNGFELVKAPRCCGSNFPEQKVSLVANVAKVSVQECRESNSIGAFVGTGAGALMGLRYFGMQGAIGGALLGNVLSGNHAEVCAEIELGDGRKFVASMNSAMFKRVSAIANRDD